MEFTGKYFTIQIFYNLGEGNGVYKSQIQG